MFFLLSNFCTFLSIRIYHLSVYRLILPDFRFLSSDYLFFRQYFRTKHHFNTHLIVIWLIINYFMKYLNVIYLLDLRPELINLVILYSWIIYLMKIGDLFILIFEGYWCLLERIFKCNRNFDLLVVILIFLMLTCLFSYNI